MKIDRKILQVLLFIGIMLPSLSLTAFRSIQLNDELNTSAMIRRQSVADLSAAILQEKFDHIKDLNISFATRVRFREMIAHGEWENAIKVLKDSPKNDFPFIERFFVTDPSGVLMADYPEIAGVRGRNFSDRDWYRSVSKDWRTCVSEIYQRAAVPRYEVVAVASPIREPQTDRVVGILVMQIRLTTLVDWARSINTGLSVEVYFADKNGRMAGWWPEILADNDVPSASLMKPIKEALLGRRGAMIVSNPVAGGRYVVAYSPVAFERWAAIVAQPESDAFGMKRRIMKSFWASSMILVLLNALLALLILRLQKNILHTQRERARADAEREQLELFAFVASHDLQEPLNKIMSFGSLLNETSRAGMDEASRHNLDRMLAASHRMSQMIEDIRSFSTIREKSVREQVDLNAVIAGVIEDFGELLQSCGGSVEVAPLPGVSADPAQMKILFRNLIGNAIKYRKNDTPLRVVIDTEAGRTNLAKIRIRDNGIGFDEKYLSQIFAPFKRLHTHAQYEGTGLGLAICQRITALHGGSITAHSRDREGAVFIVSLPIKKV